jgi:Zn-dependent protease with chaperone function
MSKLNQKIRELCVRVDKGIGEFIAKVEEYPRICFSLKQVFYFSIVCMFYIIVSSFQEYLGSLEIATIFIILFLFLRISALTIEKLIYKPNIVKKNPDFLDDLDINIPVDIYVYKPEVFTTQNARFSSVRDRIEVNKDIIERYKNDANEIYNDKKMKGILIHELAHYERKWKDSIITSLINIFTITMILLVLLTFNNVMFAFIIISLIGKGSLYLQVFRTKYVEKKADQITFQKGYKESLIELWDYRDSTNKIKLSNDDILHTDYPTKEERHIWIMQFAGKID